MDEQLILLPTTELLEKFGAGKHVLGSGSAAAFSGILACKLYLTVIKLTREKEKYAVVEPRMNFIERQIVDVLEPALFDAFQKDSDEFNKVIEVRLQRNQETDPKKRKQLADQARGLLRPATG